MSCGCDHDARLRYVHTTAYIAIGSGCTKYHAGSREVETVSKIRFSSARIMLICRKRISNDRYRSRIETEPGSLVTESATTLGEKISWRAFGGQEPRYACTYM